MPSYILLGAMRTCFAAINLLRVAMVIERSRSFRDVGDAGTKPCAAHAFNYSQLPVCRSTHRLHRYELLLYVDSRRLYFANRNLVGW